MRPAGRQSSVIRFPSTCCAVYILSQHRADFSTGSACGPLRACFAPKRCEDSLTFFTQYFAPETGAHSEQVSRLFILILSALFVVLFVLEKPLRHLPPESITRGTVLYQRSRPNAHFENPLELL
jgi:hypothetical protein